MAQKFQLVLELILLVHPTFLPIHMLSFNVKYNTLSSF